jgi:hypothetical protein
MDFARAQECPYAVPSSCELARRPRGEVFLNPVLFIRFQTSLRFPMHSYSYPISSPTQLRAYATVIVVNTAVNIVFVDMPAARAPAKQIYQDLGCGEYDGSQENKL